MERWQRAGVLRKPTQTWWDVRMHPALGTLELRAPDQPTDLRRAGAFVALLHALGVWAANGDGRPASRADAHTNRFFASRFGPRAQLIHPTRTVSCRRPSSSSSSASSWRPTPTLELLEPLDGVSCEADLQLAAGDPHAACGDAVERSLASPG